MAAKPTTQRSLADLIAASPFVTLRALSGDREEAQITALGQNNRYNSIQIDGSRINDQFGLNGTGLASFYNPLSLETLEQLSIQVSPYDVRQAGFTGASPKEEWAKNPPAITPVTAATKRGLRIGVGRFVSARMSEKSSRSQTVFRTSWTASTAFCRMRLKFSCRFTCEE